MARSEGKIDAVRTLGPDGPAPVLLICEHASNAFPEPFGDLGLDAAARQSHAAWDPGALDMARRLSDAHRLPLVQSTVSRLIYDCNRPPEAADAIPAKSEVHEIPGNRGLGAADKADRIARVYKPFAAAIERAIARTNPGAIITIHSFTPVFHGAPRDVEIGILYDRDTQLADELLSQDWGGFEVRGNDPYGPEDGVTHTLKTYGVAHGIPNAMLEIRNDLLDNPVSREAVFRLISLNLVRALDRFGIALEGAK